MFVRTLLPILVLPLLMACPPPVTSEPTAPDPSEPVTTPPPEPLPALCINEVMADNSGSHMVGADWPDWIELHNPSDDEIALDGWTIEDRSGEQATLDATHVVPAGGYLLLYADGVALPFRLDATGDEIVLRRGDGASIQLSFPGSAVDHAFARQTDCCEGDCFTAVVWGTPGRAN